MLSCLVFEDEHLLVVDKPAGLNTHAPSPYAGEGIYDWLRQREPRWARLAIIHRLDKQTSGLLVFSKTTLANRSLTQQFTERSVGKKYIFVTDGPVPDKEILERSLLVRAGEKYFSRAAAKAETGAAVTRFRLLGLDQSPKGSLVHAVDRQTSTLRWVEAEPLTGKTHQIRVHAADLGFPIYGDILYGGTGAARVFLHATRLTIRHPETNEAITFESTAGFEVHPGIALRTALIDPDENDAWRVCQGASDNWPGWYLDRVGDFLLSQSDHLPDAAETETLATWQTLTRTKGVSHRIWLREKPRKNRAESSPRSILGELPPPQIVIRENAIRYELRFLEGYSIGLFFDQRDNRRRILVNHIAADFPLFINGPQGAQVLNTFAYTCGFSVCAAKAGARTTSLDLSKKNLDWGKRTFALNGLDSGEHDFIFGDVFDWLSRLTRKKRAYDLILLDPPTFSQSKQSGPFRAEKDYGRLVRLALPLLKSGGVLFASTNAAGWAPEEFISSVRHAIAGTSRRVNREYYAPQPPDFPISRGEPAYLKTVWLRVT